MAQELKAAFQKKGIPLLCDTLANQIFPILTQAQIERLQNDYIFAHWQPAGEGRSAVRFCASVTTEDESIQALLADISRL